MAALQGTGAKFSAALGWVRFSCILATAPRIVCITKKTAKIAPRSSNSRKTHFCRWELSAQLFFIRENALCSFRLLEREFCTGAAFLFCRLFFSSCGIRAEAISLRRDFCPFLGLSIAVLRPLVGCRRLLCARLPLCARPLFCARSLPRRCGVFFPAGAIFFDRGRLLSLPSAILYTVA